MGSLKEGEWSCYRGGQFNGEWENGHSTEVASLMEGEWSCYRGGHFNGWRIVMLQRWSERKRSCYRGGQFNGGSMVMLQRWLFYWRENGHVTEVVTLLEGDGDTEVVLWRENGHVTEVITLK